MMTRTWIGFVCTVALALWSCTSSQRNAGTSSADGGSGSANEQPDAGATSGSPDAGTALGPPTRIGHWTYYGEQQGLSQDVRDVSADEGGNVYVAGGDALYAKARDAEQYLRFDWQNAGLSKKCNDPAQMMVDIPTTPFFQCPVISVGGAAAGKAIVGFDGFGHEGDGGAPWALETGGADVVAFDGAAGKMTRVRHVLTASPPHVICDNGHLEWVTTCDPGSPPVNLWFWNNGRRLTRRIRRVVVNHDPSSALYGDVWMGGNHGTLQVLLANAAARGWVDTVDPSFGFDPKWQDAKDIWEHIHPAVPDPNNPGDIIVGEGYGVSLDPRSGMPWGSNGIRTTTIYGYPDLVHRQWVFTTNQLAVWPQFALGDDIRSISFCPDGRLWVASISRGLGVIDPNTASVLGHVSLPNDAGALTVSCDASDGSLWVGPVAGGLLRYRNGTFESVVVSDPTGATSPPEFASHPVVNVQYDRWTSPGPRI
ncbi:MAG TPA: hypothetical protein VM683_05525, partial [Anaeromyxobacteraceae bacterium]|nr:hypothetical protein [Anaeromyxobacteraceae bacterium]